MNWMQRFFFTRTLALLAVPMTLVLWLWAPAARAALVTVDDTDSFTNVPSNSFTLNLDRFDPARGTLKAVELRASISGNGSYSGQIGCPGGASDCAGGFPGAFGVRMAFSLGSLSLTLDANSFILSRCTVPDRVSGLSTCTGSASASDLGTATTSDPAALDLFDNPGVLSLLFTIPPSRSDQFMTSSQLSGSATVTYTYDDGRPDGASVPEPGTLGASSLALLALAGSFRARRRRANHVG